jgi:hypothetical protein
MVRTAEVKLKADVADYVVGMESSAKVTEKVDAKVKDVDQSLKKLPPDAIKAAAAMKLLGTEGEGASKKIAGIGGAGSSMRVLEQRLVSARGEVKRLAEEFNRTGDTGTLQRFFSVQADVRGLEKLKRDFTKAFAEAGQEGGKSVSASLQGAVSTPIIGPAIAGGIVAAIALALPMINGLLLSTAGLGGIGLGIAGQLHDPRVQAAFADLGHGLMEELSRDTASFAGPLVDAAGILGKDLRSALGSIDFKALAADVAPLAAGLGGLVRNIMPGFNAALRAAQPLLDELDRDLPAIGDAIAFMFEQFAKGNQGALEGLRTFLAMVVGAIMFIGVLVRVFSQLYDFAVKAADGLALIAKWLEEISGSPAFHIFAKIAGGLDEISGRTPDVTRLGKAFHVVGDEAKISATKVGGFAGAAVDMADASQRAAAAAQDMFNKFMTVDQGTLTWNESLTQLHDTLSQNKRTLDEHTKAGQENVGSILSAVTANMQLYQAQVASGIGADDAAKAYDANEKALEGQLRALGYTPAAIDSIVGKYRGIPDAAGSAAKSMQDMADAVDRLNATLRKIFNLPPSKDITINVRTIVSGVGASSLGSALSALRFEQGGIRHAATGLIVRPSDPGTLIGEPQTGGEALIPLRGITQTRAAALGQVAMGGYGLDVVARDRAYGRLNPGVAGGHGPIAINLSVTVADDTGRALTVLRREIKTSYGGDVQVALGS